MTVQDYLNLIPSANSEQPKFLAVLSLNLAPVVQVQALLQSLIPLFDLDTPPVGDQLDIIGAWVGVSRNVSVPISAAYFSWDSTTQLGWDYGRWQESLAPTSITRLPDDAYLTLVRARIKANDWNGSIPGAYAIWDYLFPRFSVLIQDNRNMTYNLIILGGVVDTLTMALITGGYIPLKPEGIAIASYFASPSTGPVFAWDQTGTNFQGWDTGNWAVQVFPS